jgi:hypothetical protein
MHTRSRLTDRDRIDPLRTDRTTTNAPSTDPPTTDVPSLEQGAQIGTDGDVPAFRWSDLRPEIGARGAIITMFMSPLIGDLAARYLNAPRLAGFGVAVGCLAAASLTRRRALLIVATTPPLIFLVAITCAEVLADHASHVGLQAGRIAIGVFLTLASTAPWLLGSFAVALVIATCRGLPRCIADLRRDLDATLTQELSSHASRPAGKSSRPTSHSRAPANQGRGAASATRGPVGQGRRSGQPWHQSDGPRHRDDGSRDGLGEPWSPSGPR